MKYMKRIMVFVLGVASIVLITGCQKKEKAEAPMQPPMVSEQPAAATAATAEQAAPAAAASAPVAATAAAASAVTAAATTAVEQAAASSTPIEKPTAQQIQQAL